MNNTELNALLNLIQSSPDSAGLTASVLQLVADSAALKAVKNKVQPADLTDKKFIKFTKQEIENMPASIKQFITINGKVLPCTELRGMYQIRYNRDGFHINVASKSQKELKQKFLDKLREQEKAMQSKVPLIKDFSITWLNIIKPITKEGTYNGYVSTWRTHIIPAFGHLHLDELTRNDIQNYIFLLTEEGKNRTAKKVKQQLGASYKIACDDYNIKNPLLKVVLPRYKVEKGEAFTYAEERKIVDFCIANSHLKAVPAILLLLYTGMRSGELKSIQYVQNSKYDYIDCITEKTRQGLPDVHRRIPISPMLRKVLPYIDFEKAKTVHYRYLDNVFKMIFPKRRLHELRYTFISRCKECRCSLELVMLWSGHTEDKEVESSKVNRGYTTYSEDFYFNEIELVNYEF